MYVRCLVSSSNGEATAANSEGQRLGKSGSAEHSPNVSFCRFVALQVKKARKVVGASELGVFCVRAKYGTFLSPVQAMGSSDSEGLRSVLRRGLPR